MESSLFLTDEFRRIESRLKTAGVSNPASLMRASNLSLTEVEDVLDIWLSGRMKLGSDADKWKAGLICYVIQNACSGDDLHEYFPRQDLQPKPAPQPSRVQEMAKERAKPREWVGEDGPTMLERYRAILRERGLDDG